MNDTKNARFELRCTHWYAAEFIGDEISAEDELRKYSPIRVEAFDPKRNGKRQFHLSFYHATYPEGVRDKRYLLQTLERGKKYILTRSIEHTPTRLLLIYDISWQWLHLHCGVEQSKDFTDVERWLTNHA